MVIKTDEERHQAQNEAIKQKVLETAGTGDWLVTRGYHSTDNLVVNATGIPLSHVGVFNANSRQVIEAEGGGVHKTSLDAFVDKSFRVLVIRPRWRSGNNADSAWQYAETLVGKNYDFLGTVGFDLPENYYCSELAVRIYEKWHNGKEKFPTVIKPGELYLYGTVLYDSLPRDEM